MNTVRTIQELKTNLGGDGQESGTVQGWVNFEGNALFVRKHWSYSGGFPAYEDESCTEDVGEFGVIGEPFPYVLNGEPQYRHGVKEWPVFDQTLVLK